MVSSSDFVHLPYTPDLTRAGIQYACRSLAYTYDRMGGSPAERLRRIVAGKGVELAFRRCLFNQRVPHDNLGATPFTDPDNYDVALGGRRCDLKSFLILAKEEIVRLQADPSFLLSASALVPVDQLASEHLQDHDIYIFAYITAQIAASIDEMDRALMAGQPTFCIHTFPPDWMRPFRWRSLGSLVLKTDASAKLLLEAGGQTGNKEFKTERLFPEPRRPVSFGTEFYSLAYLYTPRTPNGRVDLSSSALKKVHVIQPGKWENIWVYGMEVLIVGYVTRAEFRQKGVRLPPGSQAFPYSRTRVANIAMPIADLNPLNELFERTREWARLRRRAPK